MRTPAPGSSLFAHFVLTMALRVDLDIAVDIYDPRRRQSVSALVTSRLGHRPE